MTAMQSLMKASKCPVSYGKNFTSKFDIKQGDFFGEYSHRQKCSDSDMS